MKKNIITIIHTFWLVSILTIVLVSYYQERTERKQWATEMENEHFMERVYMQDNVTASIIGNGFPVNIENSHFTSPKIICYYSAQSCAACINYAKEAIKNIFLTHKMILQSYIWQRTIRQITSSRKRIRLI